MYKRISDTIQNVILYGKHNKHKNDDENNMRIASLEELSQFSRLEQKRVLFAIA